MKYVSCIVIILIGILGVFACGKTDEETFLDIIGQEPLSPNAPVCECPILESPKEPGDNDSEEEPELLEILEVIDPCGDGKGTDEMVTRLSGGEVISHYKYKKEVIVTVLLPGLHETNDKQQCEFEVTEDGEVFW